MSDIFSETGRGGDPFGTGSQAVEFSVAVERGEALIGHAAQAMLADNALSLVLTDPHLPDNPIVYCNAAFCEMTGYARRAVLGRNCRFLQGTHTAQPEVDRLRRAIRAREAVSVELRNVREDGEPFTNRLMVSPLFDDSGALLAFLGVQLRVDRPSASTARDYTDSDRATVDQLETLLSETQNRVRGHLALMAGLLRGGMGEALERDEAGQVTRLVAARLDALSVLYSELGTDAGTLVEGEALVSAGEYVSRIASTMGGIVGAAHLRINVDTDYCLMERERAAKLGLITSELLTNALRRAQEAGEPGVLRVELCERGGNQVELRVCDRASQAAGTAWPTGGAGGQGSAKVVRGLAESLGATLSVEDWEHDGTSGTCFHMTLAAMA